MSRIVILDAAPLGLLCGREGNPTAQACIAWLAGLLDGGARVFLPEITDYEVRRELLRLRATARLTRLDAVHLVTEYLPISTDAMRRAAELWAVARQTGQPTAGDDTIDADMILVGQAQSLRVADAVIATTNVRHLARFFPAEVWSAIPAA